jgi:hypothetical protein
MWRSWVKTKDTTQVMHIAKLKGWLKKSYETFSNDIGKGFENGMMGVGGEKLDSHKKILRLKYFSPLKILTSPFYLQRLLELSLSFLSFFNTFSLSPFFNAPSL